MMTSFLLRSTPHPYRKIKSSKSLSTLFPIHKLSVHYTADTSFLTLNPSKISISATVFLTLISGNREFAKINSSHRVKRKDLLLATESMIMEIDSKYDNQGVKNSADQNTMMTTPKRPPNAFMLYSSSLRKTIKRTFPEYDNSDISKFLGIMWRSANNNIKQKFIQQAYEERQRHKMQYPDFEYNMPKNLSISGMSLQGGSENIQDDGAWFEEIQQFIQQTENFGDTPYSSLDKMEKDAIELLNSISDDNEPNNNNFECLPNLQWINFSPMEEMDTNSWRDMCNSVSLLFPEGSDEHMLDCPYY
ncbi:hypothetical protein BCR42DRAFT_416748 [Absidia repens]|uniref:HMG box domain-containing protein n=1 Tax=Absidia repens TaxID=90262 RepID=A0A1X2IGE7_9FUNG|nr:hypothetical protein BCR42DRAFT_416748 [Absidia repens]